MNTRLLARRALRYLAVLEMDSKDYPDSSSSFYALNEKNYQALKDLNLHGLGWTKKELEFLASVPTESQAKKIVASLLGLDEKIAQEHKNQDALNSNPSMWLNFFSGFEVIPTAQCKLKLKGIESRLERYSTKQASLFKSITMSQAVGYGYVICGMEDDDFLTLVV